MRDWRAGKRFWEILVPDGPVWGGTLDLLTGRESPRENRGGLSPFSESAEKTGQGTTVTGYAGTLDLNGNPLPSSVSVAAYYGALINEG